MAADPTSYAVFAMHLSAPGTDAGDPVDMLVELESLGVPRAWLPHLLGLDPLPVFAAAAGRTSSIRFGTAVIPTWPRHPVFLMQEAFAVQAACRGRLTLGVGVSDVPTISGILGIEWQDPIGHLGEYLAVCGQARSGQVNFDGDHYRVHAALTDVPAQRLPIVASGLNPRAVEAAARWADGLVTLLAPPSYLSAVVRPRIEARQSLDAFRLISCVPVAVTGKVEAAAEAAEELYGPFWGYTGYAPMLRAAGAASPRDVAVIGDEEAVAAALASYAAAGVDEVVAAPFPVGGDPGVLWRTVRLIAGLASAR
jgi:alkanesulfonate monooxygenase SsuD/methylene tetrahydromethanopterin reductase-like flavin-dependent oxidoreductase (luciferase family)